MRCVCFKKEQMHGAVQRLCIYYTTRDTDTDSDSDPSQKKKKKKTRK